MSRKSRDVFRVGDLTIDSTTNSNNSELIFRSKEPPYNAYSGIYYTLSSAQADDPTIRINQFAPNGVFLNFGYFYDTQFNPVPPGPRITVVGGIGDRTQEPNPSLTYSYDNIHWYPWSNDVNLLQNGGCTAVAYNGFIFAAGGSATADTKLCYSANGSSWIPGDVSANTFFENGCNVIATNGGFWIGGSSGRYRVMNSYDGINWYPSSLLGADSKLTISCKAAAWSGTLWVAGGEGIDNIIHSTDGLSWINSENANSVLKECRSVAWSGSTWIAGGIAADPSNGIIPTNMAYSLDSINWYSVVIATPLRTAYSLRDSCNAVAWSGAMWVAGGEDDASGHTLAYSYDGTAWYPGTPYVFQSCKAVSWNGNSWAAAGSGTNSLATSFDGIHWTPNADGNALLPGGGGAVAVNRILPNAATVQASNVFSSSNSLNLIGGSGETLIAFSKDGITWTPSISAAKIFAGGACTALSWNGFLWVGGFSNTYNPFNIITDRITFTMGNSEDGVTWTSNTVGSSLLTDSCVAVANAIDNATFIWVAGGSGDHRLITSDGALGAGGIVWIATVNGDSIFDASASNLIDQGVCTSVGWDGTYWIAGSNCFLNRLAFSSDGLTWTGSASGNALFTRCNALAWNGLQWIAAGKFNNHSVVASSQNGQTWTAVSDYGGYAVSGITWNTVACNESIWLLGGDVSSGDTPILFSYDGQNWSQALGTDLFLSRGCKSITWDGNLWMAVGSGAHNAIYSYNGAAWNNTYNGDSLFGTGAVTVASNRPQTTVGHTRPTPTLYATTLGQGVGQVTFTPNGKHLNSLYPAGNLFINDVSGTMGLNIVPTTHTDLSGATISPILDIIGKTPATNGIYVECYEPMLSLVNNSGHTDVDLNDTPIARIEMYDISTNVGWSITDAFNYDGALTNHLQLTSWKNDNPYTVVDIAPGDFGAGNVQINGLDPVDSGAALYVNCANITGSNAVSIKGNVHINDVNPSDVNSAALYANGSTNTQSNVMTLIGNVHINDPSPSAVNPAALYVNGSANTNSNAITTIGNVYIKSPGIAAANPGALYVNRVNPDTSDVRFGSDATNFTIRTNNASAAQLIGYPSTRFYRGGNGNYVEFNGTDFFPSPTNTLNLGLSTNHWNNFYTNTINSDGSDVSIGGTYGLRINPNLIGGVGLIANTNQLIFGVPTSISTGQYVFWNGNSLGPQITNTADLGLNFYRWNNLFVNNINPQGSSLSLVGTTGFTIGGSAAGAGNLIQANNNQRFVIGSTNNSNAPNYVYWDGVRLFPYPAAFGTPVPLGGYSLGAADTPWANLYTQNINRDRTDLLIGNNSSNGKLVLRTNGSTTQVIGSPQLDLKTGYTGGGIRINGLLNPSSVVPITGDAPYNYPVSLGSSVTPWSSLWANAINPGTLGVPDYVYESSTPGSGSHKLAEGFTYTVTVTIVGGGGGGVHWNAYYPTNSAAGGSGAYISGTKTGVPGGTVISWTIGGVGANNNVAMPSPPPTAVALGGVGGASSVDVGTLATFIGYAGTRGIVTASYSSILGVWVPAEWIGGNGGTYETTGSPTTVSGINGNNGVASGVPPFATPTPAKYSTYGIGGGGDGENGSDGYVRIVATETSGPQITYNLSSGPVYIDTLYVRNIINYP